MVAGRDLNPLAASASLRRGGLSILVIFILILGCLAPACVGPENSFWKHPASIPAESLLRAPEDVEIDGRVFVLETYLWRDFMPISPPDGKPLIASVQVTALDMMGFPPSVTSDRIWIVKEVETWEAGFSDEERPQRPDGRHQLELIARHGPKLETGIEVDVVVRLKDGDDNEYLLRASQQVIHRTQ